MGGGRGGDAQLIHLQRCARLRSPSCDGVGGNGVGKGQHGAFGPPHADSAHSSISSAPGASFGKSGSTCGGSNKPPFFAATAFSDAATPAP